MALRAAVLLGCAVCASTISVGDKIPTSVSLDLGFPPEKISLAERVAGKKVVIVGLPGAFTPTWSTRQVPGYLQESDALKKLGIDEVIVYCVNDGAVMDAWAKDQGVDKQQFVSLMGDPAGVFTKTIGMEMIHPGPYSVGIIGRCKRFALYLEDGVVKLVKVSERADDPAGDDDPSATLAPAMIEAIKGLNPLLAKTEL